MRKLKKGKKFSRKTDQRKALIRSLLYAFFKYEKIETTEAKAKEISRFADKIITRAKSGDLSARRFLAKFFNNKITKKLVEDIAKRYESRKGGYTRVTKLGRRKSDGAKTAIIELVK